MTSFKERIEFLKKQYPAQKSWQNDDCTELASDDTTGDTYDAVKIIQQQQEIIEICQQAFDDIIRLQSDVADSVAQTTLNKINKLYEGGKC